MKTINFRNVEKLVFLDSLLRNKLYEDFKTIFNSWGLAIQKPELRGIAQKMLIDFLNLVEDKHVKIMSSYFNEEVEVERIDPNVAKHIELSIHEAQDYLNSNPLVKDAMFAYREGDQLYISIWR